MTVDVRLEKAAKRLNPIWVQEVVAETLAFEKIKKYSVSVLLTGDKEIRRLNKKYLKHDYATDVISFGMNADGRVGKRQAPAPTERHYLGDVVASAAMAKSVAKEIGISFKEELARYLVHGTLHLLGYEDDTVKEKKKMHARQEKILQRIIVDRSLAKLL